MDITRARYRRGSLRLISHYLIFMKFRFSAPPERHLPSPSLNWVKVIFGNFFSITKGSKNYRRNFFQSAPSQGYRSLQISGKHPRLSTHSVANAKQIERNRNRDLICVRFLESVFCCVKWIETKIEVVKQELFCSPKLNYPRVCTLQRTFVIKFRSKLLSLQMTKKCCLKRVRRGALLTKASSLRASLLRSIPTFWWTARWSTRCRN